MDKDAGLHSNLEGLCALRDILGYVVGVPSRATSKAVREEVQGFFVAIAAQDG